MSDEFRVRNLFDDFQNGFWNKEEKTSNRNSHNTTNGESDKQVQLNDQKTSQINQNMSDASGCKDSDSSSSEDELYIDLKYSESDDVAAEEEKKTCELESESSDDSPNKCLPSKEEINSGSDKVNISHTDLLENYDKHPERKMSENHSLKQNDISSVCESHSEESVSSTASTGLKNSIANENKLPFQNIYKGKEDQHCEKSSLCESKSENHSLPKEQQNTQNFIKTSKGGISNNQFNEGNHDKGENDSILDKYTCEQNKVNLREGEEIAGNSAGHESEKNLEKHPDMNRVCAQDEKYTKNVHCSGQHVREDLGDTNEISRIKETDLIDGSKDVKDSTSRSTEDCGEESLIDNSEGKVDDSIENENITWISRNRSPRSENTSQVKISYQEKSVHSEKSENKYERTMSDKIEEVLDKDTATVGQKVVENSKENDSSSMLDETNPKSSFGKNTCQKTNITSESDSNTSSDECLPSGSNSVTSVDANNQRMFITDFSFRYVEADKTFKCSCSFSTESETIFEIHLIVNHLISRPYRCFYCKCCFQSMDEIKSHQTAAHPNKPPKSSLIGVKRAKQICLRSKSQEEYIHKQKSTSSDKHNQYSEKILEEGIEIKNDESDTTVARRRSDGDKHDGGMLESVVITDTSKKSNEISNFTLKVVTSRNHVTQAVRGISNSVGWSSVGLAQQPNITFNRFPLVPAMNPPRNPVNNNTSINQKNATKAIGNTINTVCVQQPKIAILPILPVMNGPVIPFPHGLRPVLHEVMSNTRLRHFTMGGPVQNVKDSSQNLNLHSGHQLASSDGQNRLQNSFVLSSLTSPTSNSNSSLTSSGNFTPNSPAGSGNDKIQTIERRNDAFGGSQTFNQPILIPFNPPNIISAPQIDCIENTSFANPPMSILSTRSNPVISHVPPLTCNLPLIMNSTHILPSGTTPKTSSLGPSLNSGPTTSNASTTSDSKTSNSLINSNPTTSNSSTNYKPSTSNSSTNYKPTNSNSTTNYNPTTSNSSTNYNPTTCNSSTSYNPTTSNSSTSYKPTNSNSSTNYNPTTSNSSTNYTPTASDSTSYNPTTSNSSTSYKPTTSNSSTYYKPTTSNSSTSSDPTTSNSSTSSDPTTSTKPVIIENPQQQSVRSLQEKIDRISEVFKFENNVYICYGCSTKWPERVTFWFHLWKHIHNNVPCFQCNIEMSDCSRVERLLFVIENESRYRKIIDKVLPSENMPQHNKSSDTSQFPSLESSDDPIIISDVPSPIFIDLLDGDNDDAGGEENPGIKERDMQSIFPDDSPSVIVQKFIANNGYMKTPKEMSLEEFDRKKHDLAAEITALLSNITEENEKPVSCQSSEELERIREMRKLELIREIISKSTSNSSNDPITRPSENSTPFEDLSLSKTFAENSSEAPQPTIKDSKENKDPVAQSPNVSSGKDTKKLAECMTPQFYACSVCPYSTLVLVNYRKHLLNEHSNQTLMCIHCGFNANSIESSVKHLLHHSKVHNPHIPAFQCYQKDCPYQCNTLRDFMKHVRLHNNYEFKCHCCESLYNSANELQDHYRCSFFTIVTCPTCRARSTDKQSMLKHIAKHHPNKGRMLTVVKQLICKERKENNFSYGKLAELQREWANVEDEDIEFIEQTTVEGLIAKGEKDKDDSQVIENEKSKAEDDDIGHTLQVDNVAVSSIDENQGSSTLTSGYTCHKCSFVADRHSSLDDHIAKHQDQKPFSSPNDYLCSLCPTHFNELPEFENHLQQHDEKIFYTIYECSIEGYTTNILSKIIEHVKDDFHLKACRKDNLYSEGVVMLETKVLHCTHCPYKCLGKKDLIDHKKSHDISPILLDTESSCVDTSFHTVVIAEATNRGGEDFDIFDKMICKFYNRVKGVYNCKLCEKKFKFKKPLHIHLNNHIDIPFQCASCQFSRKQLSLVTAHVRDVHCSDHVKILFSKDTTKRLQSLFPKKTVLKKDSKVKKNTAAACLKSSESTKKAQSSKTSHIRHKDQETEFEVYSEENSEKLEASCLTRNELTESTNEMSIDQETEFEVHSEENSEKLEASCHTTNELAESTNEMSKDQETEFEVHSEEYSEKLEASCHSRNELAESTDEMSKEVLEQSSDILENCLNISGDLDREKTKNKITKKGKGATKQNAEILSTKKSGRSEEQESKPKKESTKAGKRTADNFSLFMSSLDEVSRKKTKKNSSNYITEKETKNVDPKSTSKLEKVITNVPKKSLMRDVAQKKTVSICKETVSISEPSVPKLAKTGESLKEASVQYKCPKCDFHTVFNEQLMRSHLETHNFINIYECKKCSVKFHSFQQIKCHINFLHHGSMDFNLIPVIDIPLEAVYKKVDLIKKGKRKSSNKEACTSKPKERSKDSEKRPSIADDDNLKQTREDKSNKKEMDSIEKPKILKKVSKSKNKTCTNPEESKLNEISSNDEDDIIVLDDASLEEAHTSSSITCFYCHKKFTCVYSVSKHIKVRHRQKKKVCWKDTKSGCVFNENGVHIKQSETCYHKNRFLCIFCNYRSKFRGSINNHMRKTHNENPPKNAIQLTLEKKSSSSSSSKNSSASDIRECSENDVIRYLCPACDYSSGQLSVYSRHLAKHKRFVKVTKHKIWRCSVCTQRIFKKRNIETHSCVARCDPEESHHIVHKDVNRYVELNPRVKVVNLYTSTNFYYSSSFDYTQHLF